MGLSPRTHILVTLQDVFFDGECACVFGGGATALGSIMTINEEVTQPSAQRDIRPDTPPTLQLLIGVTQVSSYYLLPQSVDVSFILTGSHCRIYPFPLYSAPGRTQLTLSTNHLLDRKQVKRKKNF